MTNKLNYLIEFLGKAIWGGLVLNVSAFLFAFVSVIVSTRIDDEQTTIITAFLIVAPFTAIFSLMGFNKIKQKVKEGLLIKLVNLIKFIHRTEPYVKSIKVILIITIVSISFALKGFICFILHIYFIYIY